MTTINTIHDLLELLRSEPAWTEELRAILLTKELLELPSAVASLMSASVETNRRLAHLESDMALVKDDISGLKEDVGGLKEDVSGLKEDVGGLKEDVSGLKEDVGGLKEDVSGLKEDVGGLKEDVAGLGSRMTSAEGNWGRIYGWVYERRVEQSALARTFTDFGFSRSRISMSQNSGTRPDFHSAIDNALERGNLSVSDVRSIFDADLIIRSGDGRYALFEISVTAGSEDISRAKARAEILADALEVEVKPAVVSANLPDPQRQQAEEAGVEVIIITDN
jgi:uncharacterized protein YoxC